MRTERNIDLIPYFSVTLVEKCIYITTTWMFDEGKVCVYPCISSCHILVSWAKF